MIAATDTLSSDLLELLTLSQYNTRVVLIAVGLLGASAGCAGTLLLLRKRALLSDAMSHATLPGLCIGFLIAGSLGMDARSPWVLLPSACMTALASLGTYLLLLKVPRIRPDAALAIVLSGWFGLGVVLLGILQQAPNGNAGGLDSFIYGKAATIRASDTWLIAACAVLMITTCVLLLKELRLICFDASFARGSGWPVWAIDGVSLCMVILVTVVGLHAVGLILVVALLIIPPVSARFWTHHFGRMMLVSAIIGFAGAVIGGGITSLVSNLPSGAVIVLVCSAIFITSLLFGADRGLVKSLLTRRRSRRKTGIDHLLRAMYEQSEHDKDATVSKGFLSGIRTWRTPTLESIIRLARRRGFILQTEDELRLTRAGLELGRQLTRRHRLWELYLIHHAMIDPTHVDRDADDVEHFLDASMVRRLETLLQPGEEPRSPHHLEIEDPST